MIDTVSLLKIYMFLEEFTDPFCEKGFEIDRGLISI